MGKENLIDELKDIYKKWRTSEKNFFERMEQNHEFKKLDKKEKKLAIKEFSEFANLEDPISEDDFSLLEEEYLGIPRLHTENL